MKGFLKTCQFATSFEKPPAWEATLRPHWVFSCLAPPLCLCLSLILAERFTPCCTEMQTPRGQGLFAHCLSPHCEGYLAGNRCSINADLVSMELKWCLPDSELPALVPQSSLHGRFSKSCHHADLPPRPAPCPGLSLAPCRAESAVLPL